jgi:hypothetical protein
VRRTTDSERVRPGFRLRIQSMLDSSACYLVAGAFESAGLLLEGEGSTDELGFALDAPSDLLLSPDDDFRA